jgi:hypothetical protein
MGILLRLRLFLPVLLATVVGLWKAPHLGLLAGVARGDLDGTAVPVAAFTPERFQEDTAPMAIGLFTINVPRTMTRLCEALDDTECVLVEGKELKLAIWCSCPQNPASIEDSDGPSRGPICPGQDEVALTAAAYAAGSRDLSFRMSAEQVQSLQSLLKAKTRLALSADRVEVVRTKDVKGLLLSRRLADGRVALSFECYSLDGRTRGLAMFLVDEDSAPAMRLARAVVSSMRVAHG